MLAVRRLVEPTAVSAICVLRLESNVATPTPCGGRGVVLAAIAESIHVFDLTPTSVKADSISTVSLSALELQFCPRGHVFNVGCGVSGLLALANQCFVVWTRDHECLLVRYQANLFPPPPIHPMVIDSRRVYRMDGQPSPLHNKEHHWYVVRRMRLWCPDTRHLLSSPEMGVNEEVSTFFIRFSKKHVFLVHVEWHSSCKPGAKVSDSERNLRTCRWHTGNYMRAYAGTGFYYPSQSCSVATRRPYESMVVYEARLESLWYQYSPFSNIPDEDLIGHYSVQELAEHKRKGETVASTVYRANSPLHAEADYCGVSDVQVQREAHTFSSPLTPSPPMYCGASQGGFANVRTTGGRTSVHHTSPTFAVSNPVFLKEKRSSWNKSAIVAIAPRPLGSSSACPLIVLLGSASQTTVYQMNPRSSPSSSESLLFIGHVIDSVYPCQVLLCSHNDDVANNVWVALSDGTVTRLSASRLCPGRRTAGQKKIVGWPRVSVSGLPSSFYCRCMLPADDLIGAYTHLSSPERVGSISPVYPCAERYAIFTDWVQEAYLVDLVESRVVAAMASDGPMTDICEAPHGFVASFAKRVLRYLQPGVLLHVCGTAALNGVTEALYVARVRCGTGSDGVAPGVYLMCSTRFTSLLFVVENGGARLSATSGWVYVKDEPTLAFGAGFSSLAQCTATRWCVGRIVHSLPEVVTHASITELPSLGPVCVGAMAAMGSEKYTKLVVGTESGVDSVQIADVAAGLLTCVAVSTVNEDVGIQVVMGRWEGGVTVAQLQCMPTASWQCVAACTVHLACGTGAPVQRLLSLPCAGTHARWMVTHISGEVSIMTVAPLTACTGEAAATGELPALVYAWVPVDDMLGGSGAPLSPTVLVPILRAGGGDDLNGFDGALLQPRDGAVLFFSVPLEDPATRAASHPRWQWENAAAGTAWGTRLEHTVRAILEPFDAAQVEAPSWREAVLFEDVTANGSLTYVLLVAHHDKLTLLSLDQHLFICNDRAATVMPLSSRAYALVPTAPTRYVCAHQITLPQTEAAARETLLTVASSPDGIDGDLMLCVTVTAGAEATTRLTTVRAATLQILDTVVRRGYAAHWMAAVPVSASAACDQTSPLFLLCTSHASDGVQLQVVTGRPLHVVSSVPIEMSRLSHTHNALLSIDGSVQHVPSRAGETSEQGMSEVFVVVAVGYDIHLFVLKGRFLYFQHRVASPGLVSTAALCYPVVTVCTQGDVNIYLQVYPADDRAECLPSPNTTVEVETRALRGYSKVLWKMRVEAREPTLDALVIAQASLYDRCVRTDLEGDVSVMYASFTHSSSAKTQSVSHVKRENAYVGSTDGPQCFLSNAVRLQSVPTKARFLRRVDAIRRRTPRQLGCNGRCITLQSLSYHKDGSARLLLLPCQDGSLYGACELPFGVAHLLMRLEQIITDSYSLDLSASIHPKLPRRLQHTYHLRPFHMVHALQPVAGAQQTLKQACVMVDAVNEYFVLRDFCLNGSIVHDTQTTEPVHDVEVMCRKFLALDEVVQTFLDSEFDSTYTVNDCAEVLSLF